MRCIISGSRSLKDYAVLIEAMNLCGWQDEITEVVSGGADGVDAMAEQWAKQNGILLRVFPADWNRFNFAAGPIRNLEMGRYAAKDNGRLVAIPREGKSPGTYNMIGVANRLRLPVFVYEV